MLGSVGWAEGAGMASTGNGSGLPVVEDVVDAGGARLDVPGADWLQVADGAAWATLASQALVRLDAGSGAQNTSIPMSGQACLAMDVGFDSLWIGVCSRPSEVLRVDLRTAEVRATVTLPGRRFEEEGSLAAGEGAVWAVTKGPDRTLLKIDPRQQSIVQSFPVPGGTAGVRAGLGGLWLTDPSEGRLLRLDPATGKTLASVPTGAGARFLAIGEGDVWVQNNGDGTVTRVDAKTNRAVATIRVDDGPVQGGDLAVGGGFVWARVSGALVAKIDPRTNVVTARYGPACGSGSVAADDQALWVSAHDVNAIFRLPLR